jgi:inorganic pyrophosphatase
MAEEQFIPLNDSENRKMIRKNSHGSDSDLDLSEKGEGLEYRVQAVEDTTGKKVSLWHDISLVHIDQATKKETPYLNFVCEIPKFTRKKYEIATDEVGNPIKQDEKKGTLREFKKGDIFFNYGCFPQTWEDPTFIHPDADGTRGDNDPLDVCEIGARIIAPGVSTIKRFWNVTQNTCLYLLLYSHYHPSPLSNHRRFAQSRFLAFCV